RLPHERRLIVELAGWNVAAAALEDHPRHAELLLVEEDVPGEKRADQRQRDAERADDDVAAIELLARYGTDRRPDAGRGRHACERGRGLLFIAEHRRALSRDLRDTGPD